MGRLERSKSVERDWAVLERILALLLALAALTDRAAGLPFLKRLQLLAMLGHGEAEARMLIVAMASGASAEAAAAPILAGDAGRLAARFRMLAFALNGLLAQVRGEPPRWQVPLPTDSPGRKPRPPAQSTPSPALRATSPPAGERGVRRRRWGFFCERCKGASVAIGAPLLRTGGEVAREA